MTFLFIIWIIGIIIVWFIDWFGQGLFKESERLAKYKIVGWPIFLLYRLFNRKK